MESSSAADNRSMGTETAAIKVHWVILTCTTGKFIAQAIGSREYIDEVHGRGGLLKCLTCFDYGCPMQMTPLQSGGTRMGKLHYSSRMDSTLCPCPVQFNLTGAQLYYLEDLDAKGGDYTQYKDFIKKAIDSAEAAAKERSARNSNIVLATNLPGDQNGRGLINR